MELNYDVEDKAIFSIISAFMNSLAHNQTILKGTYDKRNKSVEVFIIK